MKRHPEFTLDKSVTYSPVGQCIYCNTTTDPLKREHIIPHGLGGTLVLPKSSCGRCEDIMKAFEGDCQRRMMGNFRMTANLPTSRPRERPKSITTVLLLGEKDKIEETRDIPVTDYPVGLTLLIFEQPGILADRPPSVMLRATPWIKTLAPIPSGAPQNAWVSAGGIQPLKFGKLLCKIAHGYAVAELGIGKFKPLALKVVMSELEEFTHLVGSHSSIPPAADEMHGLRLAEVTHNSVTYAEASIRLFSRLGTPIYRVVVGELFASSRKRSASGPSLSPRVN